MASKAGYKVNSLIRVRAFPKQHVGDLIKTHYAKKAYYIERYNTLLAQAIG
jgi:hypothetical protein